jgi:hypothetical protein
MNEKAINWLLAARTAESFAAEARRLSVVMDGAAAAGDDLIVPIGTRRSVTKARALASLLVDLTAKAI